MQMNAFLCMLDIVQVMGGISSINHDIIVVILGVLIE
jgi:hypothetical protein